MGYFPMFEHRERIRKEAREREKREHLRSQVVMPDEEETDIAQMVDGLADYRRNALGMIIFGVLLLLVTGWLIFFMGFVSLLILAGIGGGFFLIGSGLIKLSNSIQD